MNANRAKQLLKEEIRKHAELSGWRFGFSRSVRQFGCCDFTKRIITISKVLTTLNEEARVLNTIRHEVAHALAGWKNGHNNFWRQKAIELGCDGKRCYDSKEVTTVERPYIGKCPNCGYETKRYRRQRTACSNCCDKYNNGKYLATYAFVWRENK